MRPDYALLAALLPKAASHTTASKHGFQKLIGQASKLSFADGAWRKYTLKRQVSAKPRRPSTAQRPTPDSGSHLASTGLHKARAVIGKELGIAGLAILALRP